MNLNKVILSQSYIEIFCNIDRNVEGPPIKIHCAKKADAIE